MPAGPRNTGARDNVGMRITSVRAVVVNVSPKTNWSFVVVETDDGLRGVGECSLNGWEPLLSAYAAMRAHSLVGSDDRDVERLAPYLAHSPGGLVAHAVDSALEQALTDIAARRRDVPIHALLAQGARASVPVYANINRGTTDRSSAGFAESARRAVAAGFAAVKIAPFDGVVAADAATTPVRERVRDGIDRIFAVRDVVGPDIEVLVDCHWRLDEALAAEVIAAVVPARLYWLECPISEHPSQWPAIRGLRRRANDHAIRLAGAETVTGPDQIDAVIAYGLYDAVMPDIKYAGGYRGMLRIAQRVADAGIEFAPHNPTGPVATFASLHASALAPTLSRLEFQLAESPLSVALVDAIEPVLRGGEFVVPSTVGLGVALDEDACARHPARLLPPDANLDPRLG